MTREKCDNRSCLSYSICCSTTRNVVDLLNVGKYELAIELNNNNSLCDEIHLDINDVENSIKNFILYGKEHGVLIKVYELLSKFENMGDIFIGIMKSFPNEEKYLKDYLNVVCELSQIEREEIDVDDYFFNEISKLSFIISDDIIDLILEFNTEEHLVNAMLCYNTNENIANIISMLINEGTIESSNESDLFEKIWDGTIDISLFNIDNVLNYLPDNLETYIQYTVCDNVNNIIKENLIKWFEYINDDEIWQCEADECIESGIEQLGVGFMLLMVNSRFYSADYHDDIAFIDGMLDTIKGYGFNKKVYFDFINDEENEDYIQALYSIREFFSGGCDDIKDISNSFKYINCEEEVIKEVKIIKEVIKEVEVIKEKSNNDTGVKIAVGSGLFVAGLLIGRKL